VQVVTNGGVVTTTYTPAAGALRLWTVDSTTERNTNSVAEGGHWIPPNVPLTYAQVFGSPAVQVVDLHIEGVNPCTAADGLIRAEFAPLGGLYLPDEVHVTILKVDLDIDTNNDGTIDDADEIWEENPGGFLCVGNTNDLKEIQVKLEPAGLSGSLKLSAEADGAKIRVWEDKARTKEVSLPKTWTLDGSAYTFPTTLYVEGVTHSEDARDIHLQLRYSLPTNADYS
jgi:hypothetical protein